MVNLRFTAGAYPQHAAELHQLVLFPRDHQRGRGPAQLQLLRAQPRDPSVYRLLLLLLLLLLCVTAPDRCVTSPASRSVASSRLRARGTCRRSGCGRAGLALLLRGPPDDLEV